MRAIDHDIEQLEALRLELANCHCAVVAIRGQLIEALGDAMCGGPKGPSVEEEAALEHALQAKHAARQRLERFASLR